MPLLDPAQIKSFQEDGFVVTAGIVAEADLAALAPVVDAEVARRAAADRRAVTEKGTYEQSFIQCMRLWETEPAIRPLTLHAGLAQAAAELLGVPRVRLWQDQALYKEPGGRITDAHQDAPFWPTGDAPIITAWIPFDDTRQEDGAMSYVPGSHNCGRLTPVDITHTTKPHDILQDPALEGRRPRLVEPNAGEVVWHHGMTVHQAGANQSARTRRVFTVVYIADGYARRGDWVAFPLDRDAVADGAPMEGAGMPVVWPREADFNPQPHPIQGGELGPQWREGS